MHPVRIVIADDHTIVREGLKMLLNAQPDFEVVAEVGSGQEVFKTARELQPDVIVMDVSMPGMDGAQATRRLKEFMPGIRVLALSAHEDEVYVRQMLTLGAAGYILKRTASGELTKAIKAVMHGGVYVDPFVAGKVMAGFINRDTGTRTREALSRREEDVLKMMAHGHSNKEIGERLCISVKSVETYKSRFCEKLGLKTRAEIVRYALNNGWIDVAQN